MPVVERRGGRDVFYAETGCGFVVCIDLGSGDALWRFRMATGAANASVVLHGDLLILPYAMSDSATTFATVRLQEILAAME